MNRYDRIQELNHFKRIAMKQVAADLGLRIKLLGTNLMFKAAWRKEKNESVSIRKAPDGIWVWVDHGAGMKGTNIDLVMKVKDCSYISAVKWLRERYVYLSPDFCSQAAFPVQNSASSQVNPAWEILACRNIQRLALLYWRERKLTFSDLANAYVRELRIRHNKSRKTFWTAGHRNIDGGWELFMPIQGSFKSCVSPKSVSWIEGNRQCLIIAESIIDAIAASKITGIGYNADKLALNSTRLNDRAVNYLIERNLRYNRIILALDNDKSGKETASIMEKALQRMSAVERMKYNYGNDPSSEWKLMWINRSSCKY